MELENNPYLDLLPQAVVKEINGLTHKFQCAKAFACSSDLEDALLEVSN